MQDRTWKLYWLKLITWKLIRIPLWKEWKTCVINQNLRQNQYSYFKKQRFQIVEETLLTTLVMAIFLLLNQSSWLKYLMECLWLVTIQYNHVLVPQSTWPLLTSEMCVASFKSTPFCLAKKHRRVIDLLEPGILSLMCNMYLKQWLTILTHI